jgi:hypothetical protein
MSAQDTHDVVGTGVSKDGLFIPVSWLIYFERGWFGTPMLVKVLRSLLTRAKQIIDFIYAIFTAHRLRPVFEW